ncbi:Psathyrella Velutina lectin At 1.5a resolution [Coprinellus micaceus]|uniref:Psathyrella Velutina lectin At 1.5a resolution n=1 Tax=Coprinellus micaceus TaxID=71717 RepID=A0A4Y7TCA0_COPMI|nr:Psathyrella Velutina lectin At 1.5a resolution [Coprinellus micaceus]
MSNDIVITQSLPVPVKRVATADIIGFGQDGVVILRNSVRPDIRLVIKDYGYNAGTWRVEKHVRLVGDTTGNRRSDIVGFGDAGVLISLNNGDNTFGPQRLALGDFGFAAGNWTPAKHVRYVSDLRKRGFVDIVGFGDAGILVSLNNGNGTFASAKLALNDFGYNAGNWRVERHLRFLADTTGDGLPDVVGFGESAVIVAVNKGDGTFQPGKAVINDLTYGSGGWRIEKHPRTVADLTGDGRADIIGFGDAGVLVALNLGNSTFQAPKLAVTDFGYNQGWRVEQHPRFVADINRDGRGDIVGFGQAGVYVARNNGNGTFAAPSLVLKDFGFDQGWRVDKHPRFLADLTGDGAADIVGFGENSVWVSYNDGNGNFGPVQKLTDTFAFNGGQWAVDKTVRWVADLF